MVEEIKIPKKRKEALEVLNGTLRELNKELKNLGKPELPELSSNARKEEVNNAYKKCALKLHPDKWSDESEEEQKKVTENFKAVNVAHKILIGEITEEFISNQTNDDWINELVRKFKNRANELRKERHGSHLSEEEIDLFDALFAKDLKKTKSLLEEIKNINVQSKILDTEIYKAPLHYIVQNACEEPNNGWETLLEEVLSKYSSNNLTAAHTSNTIGFSQSNVININIQGCYVISTPLHIACRLGCLDVVMVLLNYNADFNVQNANGYTPLFYALRNNETDVAKVLLEYGAKIDVEYCGKIEIIRNIVQYSCDTVKTLLPYISDRQKSTMLQFLSYSKEETNDHIKIAELLLKSGADPEFYGNEKGEMPNSSSGWAEVRKKAKLQELFNQYKTASNTTKQPTTTTHPQQKQPISGATQTVVSNATPLQQPPVMNSNPQPTITTAPEQKQTINGAPQKVTGNESPLQQPPVMDSNPQPTITTFPQQKQPISGAPQKVTGSAAPFEEILIDNETNNNLESEKQDNEQPITTHDSKQEHFLGISTRGWIIISTCAIAGALALYFLAPLILGATVGIGAKLGLGAAGALTGGVIGGGMACLTKVVISKCCGEEAAAQHA